MDEYLEKFLNITPGFKGEWTIKFFSKGDIANQNSFAINQVDRTIIDMKISDPELFAKIVEVYETNETKDETNEPETKDEKSKKNLTLGKIDLHDFVDRFIPKDNIVIGFISRIAFREDIKTIYLPGSQFITYSIN
jgi:DNA relaxase NicK